MEGTRYQLWVYLEVKKEWFMEGFYDSENEAKERVIDLRKLFADDIIPDWEVVKATVVVNDDIEE